MPGPDVAALLGVYNAQLRDRPRDRLPDGVRSERDGPLVRTIGHRGGGFVEYRDLRGLDGAELDALIARQVRFFAERGEEFEWKLHGHDLPASLSDRLLAAGLVAQEQETVLVAAVSDVAAEAVLPAGVSLREVTGRVDLDRIVALLEGVWGGDLSPLADDLEAELAADPGSLTVVVAESGGEVVCSGWVRFVRGTEFATLWGGATLPAWRSRGIYRATVAHRASLALARGLGYLEVDASEDSRPILERLGFVAVTTTTPYVWSPPAPASRP